VDWLQTLLIVCLSASGFLLVAFLAFLWWVCSRYLGYIIRIFEERPLFIPPRGQDVPSAEDLRFPTTNGLMLRGCYQRTPHAVRRGVILFGPEFGSNRWSFQQYCEPLLQAGYDIFSFEVRNQGESDRLESYEPMQWVTEYEVEDMRAAIEYLKGRPDADPNGIGIFGLSRGGGAGIILAAQDAWVRCLISDGAFGTMTTLLYYMKKWVAIYSTKLRMQRWLPHWFYVLIGHIALRRIEKKHRCRFAKLERFLPRISPKPWLQIHGGSDTYIKPELAEQMQQRAREPKELWMVPGAKHNQALHVAGAAYQQRLVEFFNKHLERHPLVRPQEELIRTA
jgi:pimeloyl-ACP methyl ester carboxylesterase